MEENLYNKVSKMEEPEVWTPIFICAFQYAEKGKNLSGRREDPWKTGTSAAEELSFVSRRQNTG